MPVVSIAKGHDPYNTTMHALKMLLDYGVDMPKTTLIKPNLLATADKSGCVNTDSRVCEAVADFLISLGNEGIICAEGTTRGKSNERITKTFTAFKNNGYYKLKSKGIRLVDLNMDEPAKWMRIVTPGLDYEVELGIAKTVLENAVASVAKFKTHDNLVLTLTLKNMMGSLCRARKADTGEILVEENWRTKRFMHGWGRELPKEEEVCVGPSKIALAKNLVLLASYVTPSLGIIDGITAMEGDGPVFGTAKAVGVIIASTDAVACDVVACEVAGFSAVETGYIYAVGRLGLGEYRLDEIDVVGKKIKDVAQDFIPPKLFQNSRFSSDAAERLVDEMRSLL